MTENIDIVVSDNLAKSGTIQRLTQLADVADRTDVNVKQLKASIRSIGTANVFSRQTAGANNYANALARLTANAHNATAAIGQINRANATAALGFGRSTSALHHLAAAFTGFIGIRSFAQAAEGAQVLSNQVRFLTADLKEQERIETRLYQLANATRSSVDTTARLYTRLRTNLQGVIKDEEEFWRMTETLNKAVLVTGRTQSEATSSILQFTQAMAKGKLDGDEFRSLLENLPILGKALEKQLGVTRGELYKMAPAGKITFDVIAKGLKSVSAEVNEAFGRMPMTIGGALTILQNNFQQFFSQNSRLGQIMANVILVIGNNLNTIIPLVIAFAAGWAVLQAVNIVTGLIGITTALVGMIPALIAAAASTLHFTLGFIAGAAAAAALVAVIAHLTGTTEELNQWITDTGLRITEFATGLFNVTGATNNATTAINAGDVSINRLSGSTAELTKEMEKLGNTATTTAAKISTAFENTLRYMKQAKALSDPNYKFNPDTNYGPLSQYSKSQYGSNRWNGPSFQDAPRYTGNGFDTIGLGNTGSLMGFKSGGQFMVGGQSGVDKNLVKFRASRNERVTVETPRQQRASDRGRENKGGGTVINLNVETPDYDSFRRSRRQLSADVQMILAGG